MTTEEYEEIEKLAAKWADCLRRANKVRAELEKLGVEGLELTDAGVNWWRTFSVFNK